MYVCVCVGLYMACCCSSPLEIADALVVLVRASPATMLHIAIACAYVIWDTGGVHHLAHALEGPRTAVTWTQAIHAATMLALCLNILGQRLIPRRMVQSIQGAVAAQAVGPAESMSLIDVHLGVVLVVVAQIQLPHPPRHDIHLAQLQINAAHGIIPGRRDASITQHATCLRCGLQERLDWI